MSSIRRILSVTLSGIMISTAMVVGLAESASAVPGGTSPAPPLQCVDNGVSGNRIQVFYTYEPGTNRFTEREPMLRQAAWEAQQNVNDSARRDGAQRWLKYLTSATGCQLTITQVQVPTGTNDNLVNALKALGYNATNRIYVAYSENLTAHCGGTSNDGVGNDSTPGTGNRYNNHTIWITYNKDCFDGHTLTHELAHALGGVLPGAPNYLPGGHCTDGYETLCQDPGLVCTDVMSVRLLDCGRDDYFAINPQGSYLQTHFNAALDSLYLGAGSSVPPLTTIAPLPPQVLRAVDVRATSVAFTFKPSGWPGSNPPRPTTQYEILRNGSVVATVAGSTKATTARVTGLAPNTTSTFTIRTVVTIGGVNRTSVPSQGLSVTTNSNYTIAGTPAHGADFLFTNDVLDGGGAYMTMDDGFSSHAEGNEILQYPRNEGLNQKWALAWGTGGDYTLTNKLSNKCLTVQGGSTTLGTPIVQSTCVGSAGQQWSFPSIGTGVYVIKSALGNLCVQAEGGSSNALTRLVTATCDSGPPTQRWTSHQMS